MFHQSSFYLIKILSSVQLLFKQCSFHQSRGKCPRPKKDLWRTSILLINTHLSGMLVKEPIEMHCVETLNRNGMVLEQKVVYSNFQWTPNCWLFGIVLLKGRCCWGSPHPCAGLRSEYEQWGDLVGGRQTGIRKQRVRESEETARESTNQRAYSSSKKSYFRRFWRYMCTWSRCFESWVG